MEGLRDLPYYQRQTCASHWLPFTWDVKIERKVHPNLDRTLILVRVLWKVWGYPPKGELWARLLGDEEVRFEATTLHAARTRVPSVADFGPFVLRLRDEKASIPW